MISQDSINAINDAVAKNTANSSDDNAKINAVQGGRPEAEILNLAQADRMSVMSSAASPAPMMTADEAGLMYEEKFMVAVTIIGELFELKLGQIKEMTANPTDISGSKSMGVEIIPALPWKPLTQNTIKDGVYEISLTFDTYMRTMGRKIYPMNAGPYMLTFSLFEAKFYLKKVSFKQHTGREWYYTWTLDFVELNSLPSQRPSVFPQPEVVAMPSVYEADVNQPSGEAPVGL